MQSGIFISAWAAVSGWGSIRVSSKDVLPARQVVTLCGPPKSLNRSPASYESWASAASRIRSKNDQVNEQVTARVGRRPDLRRHRRGQNR